MKRSLAFVVDVIACLLFVLTIDVLIVGLTASSRRAAEASAALLILGILVSIVVNFRRSDRSAHILTRSATVWACLFIVAGMAVATFTNDREAGVVSILCGAIFASSQAVVSRLPTQRGRS